ncbi:threonine synthase [Corallincola luteus]|uniref:Threonine synthase n=2 Tax=Corallincola TaxID=1775176 RepID=A0A368NQQ1_9GAMM|nr:MULTISPECIES: threonine synthase [Corallincola]RCU51809.1 threonine synthase [Corallincola holothuriorum]TCI04962.1 threonine synthase [Corallincola luteus]
MNLYNIKDHSEQVSFQQAVRQGLGRNQGLFFPADLPFFDNIDELLAMDLVSRSKVILGALIGEELSDEALEGMLGRAFHFPAPVKKVTDKISALELFHGPTLAFKDFGGRFMAQCLREFGGGQKITILTATSGDTGAAVAHAFHGIDNIDVLVMYPKGKISKLQEALFCTLGDNIHTLAVEGTFDDCQTMVKQAFDDVELREAVGLNSANSINISRLMAQICYYFEAVAQMPKEARDNLVISVPSGNFGNLTAGLLGKAMGLPVKRFIAATNVNDTVPRYLQTGEWAPKETIPTLANAMDVSAPNNWPRIEELCKVKGWGLDQLGYGAIDDATTVSTLQAMNAEGYLCEPHGAIAYHVLNEQLQEGEYGLFLCTAHPAKFKESVDEALSMDLPLPKPLADAAEKPLLSETIAADFSLVRAKLMSL